MKELSKDNYGVMIGRFCPVHLGHEAMIKHMLCDYPADHIVIIVGSVSKPISFRNIFSFKERASFLMKVIPYECNVIGLSDFPTNEEWIFTLDNLLKYGGIDPKNATFYGGCKEDMEVLIGAGKSIRTFNRFDGSTPKISATELRDALLNDRYIHQMINEKIASEVREAFQNNWKILRNS